MSELELVPVLLVVAKALLTVVGTVCLLSGLDDAFVDLCFLALWVRRGPVIRVKREAALWARAEQPIAIMVPAWDEAAVIRRMVGNMLETLTYGRYHVFVGTYPNDPATRREVDAVAARFPNVHRVVCANDGPTCKSDCLNWIYQGILDFERASGVRFAIFVVHDAEDLPHRLSLKLFNRVMPPNDMVQLPVLSLPVRWHQLTAGHYLDEFAEHHFKDVVVRQWLTRTIPAAGAGCAFSRRALETIAARSDNQVFNVDSLTEDYELGLRLGRLGLRQAFVTAAIAGRRRDYVATWEHFPARFRQSVRQKSRWIVGIALQGWKDLGWFGGLRMRYALLRDRKGLITNPTVILGYVAVAFVIAVWIATSLIPDAYRYPALVEPGSALWYLMWANGAFMAARVLQRALCVGRVYGGRQALLAVPRQVWSNVVNFAATARALRLWARHRVTGRPIAWDKTGHVFPSDAELSRRRREAAELPRAA
jgi:adsorption protein B